MSCWLYCCTYVYTLLGGVILTINIILLIIWHSYFVWGFFMKNYLILISLLLQQRFKLFHLRIISFVWEGKVHRWRWVFISRYLPIAHSIIFCTFMCCSLYNLLRTSVYVRWRDTLYFKSQLQNSTSVRLGVKHEHLFYIQPSSCTTMHSSLVCHIT